MLYNYNMSKASFLYHKQTTLDTFSIKKHVQSLHWPKNIFFQKFSLKSIFHKFFFKKKNFDL